MQYELSKEQEFVINKCINGENMFITGNAGVGKSLVIKVIKNIYLPSKNITNLNTILEKYKNVEYKNIQVCAMTGIASVLLECCAKTIHSWSGIGICNGTNEQILTKIKNSSYYRSNWRDIEVLIIDEVSMMSQYMFELLDFIGKNIRRCNKPFGGIQVILFGDYYQLGPISKDPNDKPKKNFCFESPLWFDTFPKQNNIELIKIFRQTDEKFKQILNQIREGKIRRSVNEFLIDYVGRDKNLEIIQPTKLFPKRSQVDYINSFEMDKLQGEIYDYDISHVIDLPMTEKQLRARKQFTDDQIALELAYLQSNIPCEKNISLKLGAQVMCVVNINVSDTKPICNGSQGIIIGFDGINNNPIIKFSRGFDYIMSDYTWASETIPGIGVKQMPLMLAWALTIHKSQGATMDAIEVDAGTGIFECGQTYVALSRVKTLEGLYLSAFDINRIKVNKKVIDFYDNLRKYHKTQKDKDLMNNALLLKEADNKLEENELKDETGETEEDDKLEENELKEAREEEEDSKEDNGSKDDELKEENNKYIKVVKINF
jgi:ATP-dependent DNA helicase PIF1